jgi:hypothetical protein
MSAGAAVTSLQSLNALIQLHFPPPSFCQTPLEVKKDDGEKETLWVPTILIIDETKLLDEDPKAKYVAVFCGLRLRIEVGNKPAA